jgi:hypothetical protein
MIFVLCVFMNEQQFVLTLLGLLAGRDIRRAGESGQRLVDTRQPSRLKIRHRLFACR